MPFTQNQELAITLSDRNILVSAAAGSGKTSVLVERIIRKITDEKKPISIDHMLVMTFTNAAAKEMKDRIRAAIENRLEEDPYNDNLIKQSILIHNANITTIHGFCQGIIREHFEELSIDPNFRVGDGNECTLIKMDTLDEVMLSYYEEGDREFLDTVECFSSSKSDKRFAELVLELYEFSQSSPDPDAFLDECVKPYEIETVDEFEKSDFVKAYVEHYINKISMLKDMAESALMIVSDNEDVHNYYENISDDCDILAGLSECRSYTEIYERINKVAFGRLKSIRTKDMSDESLADKEKVSQMRGYYKSEIEGISKAFSDNVQKVYEDMRLSRNAVSVLTRIVKSFGLQYSIKKRDKNIIDFNDMEHMAIKVLRENPEIAENYRDYYEEIYVDEYQDSNMTQETLLNLIKRDNPNGNLFMVGDVKQSIYRFRQARPDLFVNKYDTYTDEESGCQRIMLNDNFRSRSNVIKAVNEVFCEIMKKENGGIEYDDDAALKYGATYYDDTCDDDSVYDAEVIIGTGDELPKTELVTNIIASKIKEYIASKMHVYDAKTRSMRPIRYGDICILARSVKSWEESIKSIFANAGIPVSISSKEGYFDVEEVKTVMAFLQTLDNPLQDIPLATVMSSPIGGFTNKELAVLRINHQNERMYESITSYIEENRDETDQTVIVLKNKCEKLIDKLTYYSEKATYTPVYGIIRELVDSEYGDYVRSLDRGDVRMMNLNMLMVNAQEYGRTSFKGLFNFVRYMSLIRKYEIEDGEASVISEEDDVVRVMTIHASKGLEFPVCIVAGIDKGRNNTDEGGSVIWDASYGIGVNRIDINRRTKKSTLYKNLIKERLKNENVAEEMRVLYVAMTRAREKLILVGYGKDQDVFAKPKPDIMSVQSYQDFICYALSKRGAFESIRISYSNALVQTTERVQNTLKHEMSIDDFLNYGDGDSGSNCESKENDSNIFDNIKFVYPYKNDNAIPSKLSVSDLKHMAIEREIERGEELAPDGEQLFSETEPENYIPKFMRQEGQSAAGGTFYGTAFHRILELWKYDKEDATAEDVRSLVSEMLERNRIDVQQAEAVRADEIAYFLGTNLGKRMFTANGKHKLFREQPFVLGVQKSEINDYVLSNQADSDSENEDIVLVQGIIDAFFEEDDGIVIVDYKTDYVTHEDMLINRYKAQLEYYKKALAQITGKKVKEMIIYSSRLKKEIVL